VIEGKKIGSATEGPSLRRKTWETGGSGTRKQRVGVSGAVGGGWDG
jgi:hypothetical protein